MISVTLNSKKGVNLGIIPSTQINTYITNTATVSLNGNTFPALSQPNNTIILGDTFTHGPNTYTINNLTTLSNYNFTPNLLTAINNASLFFPITTTHSQTLGYKINALKPQGDSPIGSSLISFYQPHHFISLNIISPYASLVIGTDVYSIEKISSSAINATNMIRINPPLKSAIVNNSTTITIYSKSFNTMSYNIGTSIFEDGKKYELSFSFQSYPCIINQFYQPASVYVDFGSNSTYESGTNTINTTNKLGLLKPNFIHSNQNTALYGNVSYSTLIADDSNKPIIINKPTNNVLTVNILNEDLEHWTDNSNVGICPPYEITFNFKEI